MREKILMIILLAGFTVTEILPGALAQDPKSKAFDILAKARAAIGGKKVESINSLSVIAAYRRMMSGREMSGEVRIDLQLPDKILRTETIAPMPGMEITRLEALIGDTTWSDQQTSGTGGAMVMIKRPGDDSPNGEQIRINALKTDFGRLILGWLLRTPENIHVEYSFAGVAESPDGNADVINVNSAFGINTRLFVEQKSSRLLMMTWQGRKPRIISRSISGPARSKEEIEKSIRESEAEAAKEPEVEYQMFLDDFREVGGINFPHRLTRSIAGETNEEWEIKKIEINPNFKPEKFVKK